MSDHMRQLTEGSVWIDDKMRTLIVFRVRFRNATTVGSYELLVIPDMKIVVRSASLIETLVEIGKIQFCRECERV